MTTLLKVVVAVMLVLSCSAVFAEDHPDQDNDVLSATGAMGFYYGGKSLCSEPVLESLSYDTIKSTVEGVLCGPKGCYIQLEPIFWYRFDPRDMLYYDFTFIRGIICPDVIDEFDIQFFEDKIKGKDVKIKGLKWKIDHTKHDHDIFIFIRSPEDIEIIKED